MGRNKKNNGLAAAAVGRSVKEKHQRVTRSTLAAPRRLVVLPEKNIKSKHQSYFQFFENKDKKEKKLEFQVTTDSHPPPGFVFVPSGNPELTQACKELSREQGAMIFIVSAARDAQNRDDDDVKKLALHVHRMGHHVRKTIVEQAKAEVGKEIASLATDNWQLPETQEEINAQAEAALRDLFPRIPNFDKQMIIEHSFRKGEGYGKPKVGTSDLPLHRRVQLAVLAHIRHVHTRYDQLLKEVEWSKARKAVEKICLDILVKWRGDEETGRDQLEDILREVVVISDDSDDSDDDEDDEDEDDSSDDDSVVEIVNATTVRPSPERAMAMVAQNVQKNLSKRQRKLKAKANRLSKAPRSGAVHSNRSGVSKKDKRGFRRYEAVQKRWEEAVTRNRDALHSENASHRPGTDIPSRATQRCPSVEIVSAGPRAEPPRDYHSYQQQPIYGERQDDRGYQIRQSGAPSTGYHRDERYITQTGRPSSAFRPSEGVVVGRRICRVPAGPHHSPVPEQPLHDGDLKDFLVPSIEPVSPHSRAVLSQTVYSVIQEDPQRPEQVPTGMISAPGQSFVRLDRRPVETEVHYARSGDHSYRPAARTDVMGPRGIGHPLAHHEHVYERESRPHSIAGFPEEASRTYRVHAPPGYSHGAPPVATSTRFVRVHRDARPAEIWEPETAQMRQYSPHVIDAYGRASPSVAYGPSEHRRIVHREPYASRFEPQPQGSTSESGRPLYYEVPPPAQPLPQAVGSWRGSTFVTAQGSVTRMQPPNEFRDDQPQFRGQEPSPIDLIPAEQHQAWRVYPQHDRTPSGLAFRGAANAVGPGSNVQYVYEHQAPRDVIVLR